jgi:sugar/nucleoside kinase (ribokinase family)
MLAVLGDLVEDVVVTRHEALHAGSDTAARIVRRRGGSASGVAVVAARLGAPSRFVGQVGDDRVGHALVEELAAAGVDVSPVRFGGVTGTIVVLVDEGGERSMLTDRGASVALDGADEWWLDGVDTLHVPLYSLVDPPLSETATVLVGRAHARGIAVSVDASSESVIAALGRPTVVALLERLRPELLLANEDEARVLEVDGPIAGAITVVKRGARSALLHVPGSPMVEIPANSIDQVADSTGAGDAFAAGFLTFGRPGDAPQHAWRDDPVGACRAGHDAAAALLTRR